MQLICLIYSGFLIQATRTAQDKPRSGSAHPPACIIHESGLSEARAEPARAFQLPG